MRPGSIHKLVIVSVNAERDPAFNIEQSDQVPSVLSVIDSLLFGTGARATRETQEYLRDVSSQWQRALAAGAGGPADVFARDAKIHIVQVNLRDAPDEAARRRLLQVPTAFSVSSQEVDALIEAGGTVLRASPDFRQLMDSLEPARR